MAENRELALVLKLVADEFQKELKNSQGALSSFNNFVKDWRTQLAAAGTALVAIAKSTANYGDELFKTSQKVGIQVQALAGLQYAAKLADVDNRQLQTGLQALSRAMVDSAKGTGDGHEAFKRIGLSAVDASGKLRPMQDVLLEMAEVFSRSADGAGKTEVAMKLLGKSGADLIPLLNGGKASIQELMGEAERLGLVMSEKDARAAEEFNDAITRLDAQAKGFSITIGKHMLGPLTELMSLMNDLGSGPIADAAKFFFKGLNEQIVLFGTLVKEIGASIEFALGKSTFDQLRTKIRLFEAEASAKLLLLENPEAAKFLDGPTGGRSVDLGASKPQIPTTGGPSAEEIKKRGQEQEKIGKALLEIYKSESNAIDIRNKLQGGQGQLSEFFLAFDRQQQFRREDEAEQERLGKLILANTQREVQAKEEAQARERDGLVKNLQAWIAYDEQVGASTELRLEHQVDLVRANLAQQLDLTHEQAGKLIQAWQEVDSATQDAILSSTRLNGQERVTVELQTLTQLAAINQRFSGDIIQGWSTGLQKYLQDTQSAFGFAADMARRTAQAMEGAFRSFFFDLMDNKIKSLKDLFSSFANFAKQMIAQVLAQLATMVVLKGITGGFGGFGLGGFGSGLSSFFGGGGFGAAKFAAGGPVLGAGNHDSVRALLTPGEGVLTRKGMQNLAQLNHGEVTGHAPMNMTVNIVNSGRQDAPQINYRKQFKGMVMDIIYRDPDFRNMLAGRA